jgi:hypothetical protein
MHPIVPPCELLIRLCRLAVPVVCWLHKVGELAHELIRLPAVMQAINGQRVTPILADVPIKGGMPWATKKASAAMPMPVKMENRQVWLAPNDRSLSLGHGAALSAAGPRRRRPRLTVRGAHAEFCASTGPDECDCLRRFTRAAGVQKAGTFAVSRYGRYLVHPRLAFIATGDPLPNRIDGLAIIR